MAPVTLGVVVALFLFGGIDVVVQEPKMLRPQYLRPGRLFSNCREKVHTFWA